jgi:transcriptional regulator with XRE-family HTH domain
MSFSSRLKQERKRLGITQAQAASLLSIAKRTYCDWEAGNVTPHRYMQDGALVDLSPAKKPEMKALNDERTCADS